MNVRFVTVDVFTDRQFGGNPLAVVPDARGLTTEQMQAIAAEFNLAETTFVLPPQSPQNTAQVRIFTPRFEMPFAGHPNVGTAFVLSGAADSAARPADGDTMVFEERAGLVRMTLLRAQATGEVTGARLASPQTLSIGEGIPADVIAEACGVDVGDIETERHPPCIASCGTPFVFAEVKSRAALASAGPRSDVFARHLPAKRATGIHLYVKAASAAVDIEVRMFAPLYGVPEDPATGSANVALVGLLTRLLPAPDTTLELRISQGVDMGRPSLMQARAEKQGGIIVATYIGGACVPVMSGTLALA
jgi:trans-2,3-dihydro-3-hydroxyanthranilate isomerase